MKKLKALFAGFFRLCLRFKWVTLAVLVLMLAGAGFGYYYKEKQWEDSFEFALQELNTAIATGDMALLARRVDFNALSRQCAIDIMENMDATPVSEEGPVPPDDNRRSPARAQWLATEVQKSLIKMFTEKPKAAGEGEAKKEAEKKDETPAEQRGPLYDRAREAIARHELELAAGKTGEPVVPDPDSLVAPTVLPLDMLTQLQGKPFRVERLAADSASVVTKIEHKKAHMAVTLRLFAAKTSAGWMFNRVDGLGQMVRTFSDELRAFNTYRESLFHARNAATLELMNRTAKVIECVAMLGVEHSDGSVTMILRVEGVNTGDEAFSAASIQCALYDEPEHVAIRQQFGLTNVVKPNDNFRIDYVQNYESDDPFAAVLRKNRTLMCVPQVMSITLQRGKLLYVKPFSAYTGTK